MQIAISVDPDQTAPFRICTVCSDLFVLMFRICTQYFKDNFCSFSRKACYLSQVLMVAILYFFHSSKVKIIIIN